MRQPHPFATALIALVLLLPFTVESRARAPRDDSERADKVRAILRRNCLRCHDQKPRGGFRIFDLPRADGEGRALVVPGNPDGSLLFDLVAGGSMPPGRLPKLTREEVALLRDWIRAGAKAFPREAGQDYLLRRLIEDFGKVRAESKPHVRYLSLNHLALEPERAARLVAALRAVLRRLCVSGTAPVEPVAVEPTNTLFRIDLRDLGWDRRPFAGQPLNLFDLLLLEYPYGVLPRDPLYSALAEFRQLTRQVRPVPYLRADWLIHALSSEPLHGDFLTVLARKDSPPPEVKELSLSQAVSRDDAIRELETNVAVGRFRQVLRSIAELAPLGREARVPRTLWERRFPEVVQRLGIGTPILPIDGETWKGENNPDSPLQIQIRLVDPDDRGLPDNPRHKSRFVYNTDRYRIWVRSNRDFLFELTVTDSRGRKRVLRPPGSSVLFLPADKPFAGAATTVMYPPGRGFFTLHVFTKESLDGAPYPEGVLMNREGMRGRFVHPFYKEEGGEGRRVADPAKMIKITLPFTVVEK